MSKILFVINPVSGPKETDWDSIISSFFENLEHSIELYKVQKQEKPDDIHKKILASSPDIVVAVGGDGTIKLVAESLMDSDIPLGILPGGSANGLAKELEIPLDPEPALEVIITGKKRLIHLTDVNGYVCIHLSDVGFNAYLIRQFDQQSGRGMFGYLRAAIKSLFRNPLMHVTMKVGSEQIELRAAMIVVANGTQYGSGAVINPVGTLDDMLFEVVAVKKISAMEIFKMRFSHAPFNPEKTTVYQTDHVKIRSVQPVHFQVDGEYIGKVKLIEARVLPRALHIVVPS